MADELLDDGPPYESVGIVGAARSVGGALVWLCCEGKRAIGLGSRIEATP
jgi:hypothetical protein